MEQGRLVALDNDWIRCVERDEFNPKASLLRPQNRSDRGFNRLTLTLETAADESDLQIVDGEESDREIEDCIVNVRVSVEIEMWEQGKIYNV